MRRARAGTAGSTAARWRHAVLYAALTAAMSGCVPVGARWQNMFAALGLAG